MICPTTFHNAMGQANRKTDIMALCFFNSCNVIKRIDKF